MSSREPTLQSAIEAHKGGRFVEAEAAYRSILRRQPANADALNFLGMLTAQTGKPKDAVELLQRSVTADATNPHAWLNFGNVLLLNDAKERALEAFEKATQLAPKLPMAWFNFGVCLGRCQRPDEAASALHQALKLEPGYLPAYVSLATLLHYLGNYTEAAEVYREWLAHDPGNPMATHLLAAATGDSTPARANDEYVKQLFDDFATSFDENLTALKYRAPELIAARLGAEIPSDRTREILDAGCGTGWVGPLVRPMAGRLVGVDLSKSMVDKARARAVYDELVVEELTQFMRSRPNTFDVVASADTLVYFGALEEPLAAARQCLRPGGILVFTVERLEPALSGGAYRLETHGRYSHSEGYVREAAAGAGFGAIASETQVLRRERGKDVVGHLVLCKASHDPSGAGLFG
jgi:predicted TPR repeat methyltransferase